MHSHNLAAAILALGLLGGTTALSQEAGEAKDAPRPSGPAAPAVEDRPSRSQATTEGSDLDDQLVEARFNVELLTLKRQLLMSQISNNLQMLTQSEFGSNMGGFNGLGGLGGGIGGGFGNASSPEEAKKQLEAARKQHGEMIASMRQQAEKLSSAALETNKKRSREQRRVEELEGRIGARHATSAATPGKDQRLIDVEQKLDRILKELEGLKRSPPATP